MSEFSRTTPLDLTSTQHHPRRAAILREVAEVFALRPYHAPAEAARFEEMASALADHADPQTCADAARALVDHPSAPAALLEKLARLSPQAAVVVLGSRSKVAPARLAAAASWGPCDLAAAVATREDLDGPLASALAKRPEREIVLALAKNLSAPIDRADLKALIARARDDAELAEALLPRAEGEDGAPLLLHAGPPLRMQILATAMRRDLAAGPRPSLRLIDDDAFDAALAAAARKDRDQVAVLLGDALEIGAAAALRLLGDASGEALALTLAALGLDDDRRDLLLMFLAPGDGSSVQPYERLSRIAGTTPTRTARRLIDAVAGRAPTQSLNERRGGVSHAALSARAAVGEQSRQLGGSGDTAPTRAHGRG